MAHAPDHYEIITEPNKFLSLKRHWDDLYERSTEQDLTQSFEWCRCSWETVAKPQGRQLHCLVVWQGEQAVLIWPFITRGQFPRSTRPLGPETSEYSNVLVERGAEAYQKILWAWGILRKSLPTDKVVLPFVKSGSALHHAMVASKITPRAVEIWTTPYVSLEQYQDWESYDRSLRRDFRAELRRTRQRLTELGKLTFEPIHDSLQFPIILDWMFRRKTDWFSRTNQNSIWRDTNLYKNFLIAVAGTRMISQIRIFVLRLNNEIISAVLCRISKLRVENVIAAFVRRIASMAPDTLSMKIS
jgi:CelD/BcsL family acetyltransferase involved in cellulose biosynthesis